MLRPYPELADRVFLKGSPCDIPHQTPSVTLSGIQASILDLMVYAQGHTGEDRRPM